MSVLVHVLLLIHARVSNWHSTFETALESRKLTLVKSQKRRRHAQAKSSMLMRRREERRKRGLEGESEDVQEIVSGGAGPSRVSGRRLTVFKELPPWLEACPTLQHPNMGCYRGLLGV